MKILVAIKQVPDTATQVKIAGDAKSIETAGITWIVSPYDELAVEEALRIKEKRGTGEVVAVTLGPERAKEALSSCLAMGADRAIHVNDPAFGEADTLMTARALAAVIKQEAPALVLVGRQAIDDDMGAVGAQLAEVLGWPCALDHGRNRRRRCEDREGRAPGRGRARGVRSSAPRGARCAEGPQRAALPDAQGDHGREEERDQGREGVGHRVGR